MPSSKVNVQSILFAIFKKAIHHVLPDLPLLTDVGTSEKFCRAPTKDIPDALAVHAVPVLSLSVSIAWTVTPNLQRPVQPFASSLASRIPFAPRSYPVKAPQFALTTHVLQKMSVTRVIHPILCQFRKKTCINDTKLLLKMRRDQQATQRLG